MIVITVIKKNQNILTLEATGHSGYAESGKDIVCSAVSTLMQSLLNGLLEVVKITPKFNIDEDLAHMSISVDINEKKMKDIQILMQTTYLALKSIQQGYHKFIKIKEMQHD